MAVATVIRRSESACQVLVGKGIDHEEIVTLSGAKLRYTRVSDGHKVPYGTVVKTSDGIYWKAVGTQGVGYDEGDLWHIKKGWMYMGPAAPVVLNHLYETEWYLNFRPDAPEPVCETQWDEDDFPERRYYSASGFVSVDVAFACPLYKGPEVSMAVPVQRHPGLLPTSTPGTVSVDVAFSCPLYKGPEVTLAVPVHGGGLASKVTLAPARGNELQRVRMRRRYVEDNRGKTPRRRSEQPAPEYGTRSAKVRGFQGNRRGEVLSYRSDVVDMSAGIACPLYTGSDMPSFVLTGDSSSKLQTVNSKPVAAQKAPVSSGVLTIRRSGRLTSSDDKQAWCDKWYRDHGFSPDMEDDVRKARAAKLAEAKATPLTQEELAVIRPRFFGGDNVAWDRGASLSPQRLYWATYAAMGCEGDGGFTVEYHPDAAALRGGRFGEHPTIAVKELIAIAE